MGTVWLAEHQGIIDESPVKPIIIRWAEWYKHPDFADTLAGFQRAYEISPILREAVENIAEFYRRRERAPSLWEKQCCQRFLIEEVAVITIQARELPSLKIYPGEELFCMHVVRNGLVPEAPQGLENEQYAKIKFKLRDSHRPKPNQAKFSNDQSMRCAV